MSDAKIVITITEHQLQDIYTALDRYAETGIGMHSDAARELLAELQNDTGIGHVSEADCDAYCSGPAEAD